MHLQISSLPTMPGHYGTEQPWGLALLCSFACGAYISYSSMQTWVSCARMGAYVNATARINSTFFLLASINLPKPKGREAHSCLHPLSFVATWSMGQKLGTLPTSYFLLKPCVAVPYRSHAKGQRQSTHHTQNRKLTLKWEPQIIHVNSWV